jgi:hypothetical protein
VAGLDNKIRAEGLITLTAVFDFSFIAQIGNFIVLGNVCAAGN